MNITKEVLENITQVVNGTLPKDDSGNFLTAILWIIFAIVMLMCLAMSGFG